MATSSISRTTRVPPSDPATHRLPKTRQPARTWYRVHSRRFDALYFSSNPTHRFSHPSCPHRILYVAADLETSLWERFGDSVFDSHHVLSEPEWDDTLISSVYVPAMRLCDLSKPATRGGLSVDLAALMNPDLSIPQQWGLAIQRHPDNVLAIKFQSRFPQSCCLALFELEPILSQLKEIEVHPLSTFPAALTWLHENKIALV